MDILSCLLFILIFKMMIITKKLVCLVFSNRTLSIVLLSFPVLSLIQAFISKCIEAENSFKIQTDEFILFFIACTCISGLIGVELKKPSLMKPVLLAMWILFAAVLTAAVMCIVDHFDFEKVEFSSRDVSIQFQRALLIGLLLYHAGHIILFHYWDLLAEYQPPKSTQTSISMISFEELSYELRVTTITVV
ncbi:uncharacterized protein LOC135833608 [Planococcus citri]|uniref:uncharacterized protein LOC135833608 n=1 Tax=Planococcus citri TaxID=170843 RepID=UPI0031F7E303